MQDIDTLRRVLYGSFNVFVESEKNREFTNCLCLCCKSSRQLFVNVTITLVCGLWSRSLAQWWRAQLCSLTLGSGPAVGTPTAVQKKFQHFAISRTSLCRTSNTNFGVPLDAMIMLKLWPLLHGLTILRNAKPWCRLLRLRPT